VQQRQLRFFPYNNGFSATKPRVSNRVFDWPVKTRSHRRETQFNALEPLCHARVALTTPSPARRQQTH
jgi:hypothetical protein